MDKTEAKRRIEAAERELAAARKALEEAEEKIEVTFEATERELAAYAFLSQLWNTDSISNHDPLWRALAGRVDFNRFVATHNGNVVRTSSLIVKEVTE